MFLKIKYNKQIKMIINILITKVIKKGIIYK
jgi:hypothetical protein